MWPPHTDSRTTACPKGSCRYIVKKIPTVDKNGTQPPDIAKQAVILHTLGVQVYTLGPKGLPYNYFGAQVYLILLHGPFAMTSALNALKGGLSTGIYGGLIYEILNGIPGVKTIAHTSL